MLNIIQKKGSPDQLCGHLLAYARILPGPAPTGDFPWDDLVQNGLLVVSGEFSSQATLGEFLRREFKGEGGDALDGLVNKLREMGEDIPEGLNSDDLRKHIEGLSHMEIIPIPAKVVVFESEEALLQKDSDIFYVGEFVGVQHAHLAVSSFPILYQALYREQESRKVQLEINNLLEGALSNQVPLGDPAVLQLTGSLETYPGDLLDLLLGVVVPNLVYHLQNPSEFALSLQNFRIFMESYRFPADLVEMESALSALRQGQQIQNHHLELLCRKIVALQTERFEQLPALQAALSQYH